MLSSSADGEQLVQPWRALATRDMLSKFGFWVTIFELHHRHTSSASWGGDSAVYLREPEGAKKLFYETLHESFHFLETDLGGRGGAAGGEAASADIEDAPFDVHDFGVVARSDVGAMKNLLAFLKGFLRRRMVESKEVKRRQVDEELRAQQNNPPGISAYKRLGFLLKMDAAQGALRLATSSIKFDDLFDARRHLVEMVLASVPAMGKWVGSSETMATRLDLQPGRLQDETRHELELGNVVFSPCPWGEQRAWSFVHWGSQWKGRGLASSPSGSAAGPLLSSGNAARSCPPTSPATVL